MQLSRLNLTNLRAFDQTELHFQPGMNVIVGINGIGKSTILDSIRFLFSQVLPDISKARRERNPKKDILDFVEEDIKHGSQWLRAELRFSLKEYEFEYEVRRWQDNAYIPSDRAQLTSGDKQSDTDRFSLIQNETKLPQPVTTKLKRELKTSNEQPLVIYFSPQRSFPNLDTPNNLIKAGGQVAAFVDSLGRRELRLLEFAEWWLAQREISEESGLARRNLDVLENAVTHFLDTCSRLRASRHTAEFEHKDREGNIHIKREKKVSLLLNKSGTPLNIHQLSDGERGTLVLILDLARRLSQANPGLDDPLRFGKAIILIDELDLHLHPRWQRTIAPKLVKIFPACQFIVTTHSPFILQSLRDSNLINLHPETFSEEYEDKSIDDISEGVMGIIMPQKSERYQSMMEVAKEYYRTLARAKQSNPQQLDQLKARLDELSIPFSDDPAFTAFLEFQRESQLRDNETN